MLPYIGLIPSAHLFWGVGIIASIVYYILIRKRFDISLPKAIILCVLIYVLETLSAHMMYVLESIGSLGSYRFLSGFSLFGVFLIFPFFMIPVSFIMKIPYLKLMDYVAVGILIELAGYRIGCMCNGCCRGFEWEYGIVGFDGKRYFPTQPLEAILDLALAIALIFYILKVKKLEIGEVVSYVYMGYGLIRFGLEFTRVRTNILGPLSLPHFFALAVFIIPFIYLMAKSRKTKCINAE